MQIFYCLNEHNKPHLPEVSSYSGIVVKASRDILIVEDAEGWHENGFIKMKMPVVMELKSTGSQTIYYKDVEIVAENINDTVFFHVQCDGANPDSAEAEQYPSRALVGLSAFRNPSRVQVPMASREDFAILQGLAVRWGMELPEPVSCVKCNGLAMNLRPVLFEEKEAYGCLNCCVRFSKELTIK